MNNKLVEKIYHISLVKYVYGASFTISFQNSFGPKQKNEKIYENVLWSSSAKKNMFMRPLFFISYMYIVRFCTSGLVDMLVQSR